jgi:hypothetical protein
VTGVVTAALLVAADAGVVAGGEAKEAREIARADRTARKRGAMA